MHRIILTAACLAFLAPPLAAQRATGTFNPFAAQNLGRGGGASKNGVLAELKTGNTGTLPALRVVRILNATEAVVAGVDGGATFLLSGVDTSDWVDGEHVQPRGLYRVGGTRRGKSGRTLRVVELDAEATRKARDRKAAAREADRETLRALQEEATRKAKEKADARERARRLAADAKEADRPAAYLAYAKKLLDQGTPAATAMAKERLREVVEKFPGTEPAREAQAILDRLNR
jgi:hypothetical protein